MDLKRLVIWTNLVGALSACTGTSQGPVSVTVTYQDAGTPPTRPDGTPEPDAAPCPTGTDGCPCNRGDIPCDDEALVCGANSGLCERPACTTGDLGCACHPNQTCNRAEDGRWLYCGDGFICVETECRPGANGCGCLPDARCDEGMACTAEGEGASVCRPTNCETGAPGCGCNADRTCAPGSDGTPHVCDGERCVPVNQDCPPGALGCPCFANLGCAQGAFCDIQTYRCGPPTVAPGELGAPCRDGSSCNAGLECSADRTCQTIRCVRGDEGCGCLPNLACNPSEGGAELICTQDGTCRRTDCYAGDLGCGCTPQGTCRAGSICSNAVCVPFVAPDPESGEVAKEPARTDTCYLPCREGLPLPNGQFKACPADGLMAFADGETCLPRTAMGANGQVAANPTTCRLGSCLTADEAPATCGLGDPNVNPDVDCPDHQTCIEGACVSNCGRDADCREGRVCDRHVCRTACTAAQSSCGNSEFCAVKDGVSGTCMPLSAPSGDEASQVDGGFVLTATALTFSNIAVEGRFRITNQSPRRQVFTIEKVAETTADAIPGDPNPLFWLTLASAIVPAGDGAVPNVPRGQQVRSIEIAVESGATAEVVVAGASNDVRPIWTGTIEVRNDALGSRRIDLQYAQRPEGQWRGKMYYFGQFKVDTGRMNAWQAAGRPVDRNNPASANLGNAFLQRWVAFRRGDIGIEEFDAVLQSVLTGSWKFQTVRQSCEPGRVLSDPAIRACYPWPAGIGGLGELTTNNETEPVPSGMVELPFAMNLGLAQANSRQLEGRIASDVALQYAGNPAVVVRLATDPAAAPAVACDIAMRSRNNGRGACGVRLSELGATVVVGGRFPSDSADVDCPDADDTLAAVQFPWLLDGFENVVGVDRDPSGALRRTECRQKSAPDPAVRVAENLNFAGSNPIPDGQARIRRIELVDGLLVDQSRMLVLFKESYGSFVGAVGTEEFSAYGFMELRRNPSQLAADAFAGTNQADPDPAAGSTLGAACSPELLELNGESPGALADGQVLANRLGLMMTGVAAPPAPADFLVADPPRNFYGLSDPDYSIHYVCHATGRFDDCGLRDGARFQECPPGSGSTFVQFSHEGLGETDLCLLPCNREGTCLSEIQGEDGHPTAWLDELGGTLDPNWRCVGDEVLCERDRVDLRSGKRFYRPNAESPPLLAHFLTTTADAFRYKTRFKNRDGANIGFAPRLCIPGSDAMQYCYDPGQISELSARVDCVLATYMNDSARPRLSDEVKARTRDFLREVLGAYYNPATGVLVRDGFESLNAELLVMLGDEAYTAAFASRFDLAGIHGGAFLGSQFEVGGFDLAGPAGFEMLSLYQATQAYQLVLDRFYRNSPTLWRSLALLQGEAFLGKETVVNYLTRLVRASSQKARAWSAIAKRYESFNRSDLARRVVERAYTSAYIESMALGRFLRDLRATLVASQRQQVDAEAERAQRVYNSALMEMRDVYQDISDELTLFGLPPEYIPFPALNPGDHNAFEVMLRGAMEKLRIAADKEDRALEQNRAYETDRASFERELTQVKNTYEDRLAQICGTFEGVDGHVYPATSKHADASEETRQAGDPCGLVGNGDIFDALGEVELARLGLDRVIQGRDAIVTRLRVEKEAAARQCALIRQRADIEFSLAGQQTSLEREIRDSQTDAERMKRDLSTMQELASLSKCSIIVGLATGGDCPTAALQSAMFTMQSMAVEISIRQREGQIEARRRKIENLRNASNRSLTLLGCDQVNIDSWARVQGLLLELETNALDAMQADYTMRLKIARVSRLRNEAVRLSSEQSEAEQLTINVEAARNDPNTRIYKNDAILNADRTFQSALVDAYKATRVFEYYTSQSYAHLNDLFLVRLVSRGDVSLENYLADLADAFEAFEEQYGNPDIRVAVVSLKNDVLLIPALDEDGQVLTSAERTQRFRERLTDSRLLDKNGYLALPFGTSVKQLSPLTRDHKVLYLEVTLDGAGLGDQLGRVYVRQSGTGSVRAVADDTMYYRFPERVAVLNPAFNGQKVFAPEVYRNERLRDRPFANSNWEVVLNQRDEAVNQDIDLNSMDDIRLFIYYTDFTEL